MLALHKGLFFIFVGHLVAIPLSSDFLDFVKEQQQHKPADGQAQKPSEQEKPSFAAKENAEYESMQSLLNKLVALYALVHLGYLGYQRYYMGNIQSNGVSGSIKGFLISWTPGPLSEIIKGSDFIVDCSTVAVQALVVKSVANIMLFCAYKDLLDGVEYSLVRLKKMIFRILFY